MSVEDEESPWPVHHEVWGMTFRPKRQFLGIRQGRTVRVALTSELKGTKGAE